MKNHQKTAQPLATPRPFLDDISKAKTASLANAFGRSAFAMVLAAAIPISTAAAATFTLTDTATGSRNFPLVNAPTYQNGDFFIRRCCTEPLLGDATEEWTSWEHDFTSQFQDAITDVTFAILTLEWNTGRDTPSDDQLGFSGTQKNVLGFTTNNTSYNQEFDLIDIYGKQHVIDALNAGVTTHWIGNDSSAFFSQINAEVVTNAPEVPLPSSLALLVGGLAGILGLSRRRRLGSLG